MSKSDFAKLIEKLALAEKEQAIEIRQQYDGSKADELYNAHISHYLAYQNVIDLLTDDAYAMRINDILSV